GPVPLQGMELVNANQREGLCCFSVSGMASPNFGTGAYKTYESQYQINDRFGWSHGKHNLKFGASFRQNMVYYDLVANLIPSFNYTGGVYDNTLWSKPSSELRHRIC